MCIIAIKTQGAKINWKRLRNCFDNNPDGAGYAYWTDNGISISKGFMEFAEFKRAVESSGIGKKHEAMFHFRIATHGAINANNCHPFPLSGNESELQALDLTTDIAIAHNGIVNGLPASKTLSDTMVFIRDYLAPLGKAVTDPATHPLIGKAAGSKFAIMSETGIGMIGHFTQSRGWFYSNESYSDNYNTPWTKGAFKNVNTTMKTVFKINDTAPPQREYLWDYDPDDAIDDAIYDEWEYADYCDACGDAIGQNDPIIYSDAILCATCGNYLSTFELDKDIVRS